MKAPIFALAWQRWNYGCTAVYDHHHLLLPYYPFELHGSELLESSMVLLIPYPLSMSCSTALPSSIQLTLLWPAPEVPFPKVVFNGIFFIPWEAKAILPLQLELGISEAFEGWEIFWCSQSPWIWKCGVFGYLISHLPFPTFGPTLP